MQEAPRDAQPAALARLPLCSSVSQAIAADIAESAAVDQATAENAVLVAIVRTASIAGVSWPAIVGLPNDRASPPLPATA